MKESAENKCCGGGGGRGLCFKVVAGGNNGRKQYSNPTTPLVVLSSWDFHTLSRVSLNSGNSG